MANDVEENDRRASYTASSGQTVFDIDFSMENMTEEDLSVYQNNVKITAYTTDLDALTVTLNDGATEGDSIVIEGATKIERADAFPAGGSLRTSILNADFRRMFYILQEMVRDIGRGVQLSKSTDSSIAVTMPDQEAGYSIIWGEQEGELINGPSNSEIANAQGYAEDAADSATEASGSASEAAEVLAQVQTVYDNFDDRYLGTKTSDPTVDNDGEALQDGALYFNTTSNLMRIYDLGSTSWNDVTTSVIDGSITNAKLDDMTEATIKGRSSGSGDGDPEDLTPAQLRALADLYSKSEVDALVNLPATQVTQSSGQSFSANTLTTLNFDSEDFDDGDWHDNATNNSRITVDFDGRVCIEASWAVLIGSIHSGQLDIYKNGTLLKGAGNAQSGGSTHPGGVNISFMDECSIGDYYEVKIKHSAAATTETDYTWFSVERKK